MKDSKVPVGWLLLRAGHAVPISSLAPDDLKRSGRETIQREAINHQTKLNAIVNCLGFRGDFGNYTNEHWPRIQRLMVEHGLWEYRNLFDVPSNDLFFGIMRTMRRALADRLTLGPKPVPTRAFLGCGHDWAKWDEHFGREQPGWRRGDDRFVPEDVEETRRWVYRHRHVMQLAPHNFVGDQWLEVDRPAELVFFMYSTLDAGPPSPNHDPDNVAKVVKTLRWVLDRDTTGWVEIVPVTDRLFFLKGPDETYDFVWANSRPTPPPDHVPDREPPRLHPIDTPTILQGRDDFELWSYYHRLESWEEKDRHEAEKFYYASGGRGLPSYPGLDVVLERYLRHTGKYGYQTLHDAARTKQLPKLDGVQILELSDGRRLHVSDLVTIQQMRTMMEQSRYLARRRGAHWEAGNGDDPDHLPTAVTWYDAQAYCAWMEQRIQARVRLPTTAEYRAWFPLPDPDPDPEYDLFPARPKTLGELAPSGIEKLEEWGGTEGEPERVRFAIDLHWQTSRQGLRAIRAYNVIEWIQDNAGLCSNALGDFSCAPDSWGAYKNIKTVFRIVIE